MFTMQHANSTSDKLGVASRITNSELKIQDGEATRTTLNRRCQKMVVTKTCDLLSILWV